jgi:hypothetical protein
MRLWERLMETPDLLADKGLTEVTRMSRPLTRLNLPISLNR